MKTNPVSRASRLFAHPRAIVVAAAIAGSALSTSCDDDLTGPPPTDSSIISSITVHVSANPVPVGGSTQATAQVMGKNGLELRDMAMGWDSNNKAVATIDSLKGEIRALSAGTTVITAYSLKEGKIGAVLLTVVTTSPSARSP